MKIETSTVASFEYVLTDKEGQVIDKSQEGHPLAYLHGHGNIIPGLEKAMSGKAAGDSFKVEIEPADAYGERNEALIQTVPRSSFEGADNIEVGMNFHAETPQGVQMLTITEIQGDDVTIDANHQLAGKVLHFDISVKEVREATPEELEHGHVHGPGGHQH